MKRDDGQAAGCPEKSSFDRNKKKKWAAYFKKNDKTVQEFEHRQRSQGKRLAEGPHKLLEIQHVVNRHALIPPNAFRRPLHFDGGGEPVEKADLKNIGNGPGREHPAAFIFMFGERGIDGIFSVQRKKKRPKKNHPEEH